ncbi:MAG: hypothetical protein ACRECH_18425 [Nitrososphaerales archaeon]
MGAVERKYVPHIRHGANMDDVVKCHQPKSCVVESLDQSIQKAPDEI